MSQKGIFSGPGGRNARGGGVTPKKSVRFLSGVTGASLVAGVFTMAGAVSSAVAAPTTQSFSATYQLACNAPIVGNLVVPLTISGQAPTQVAPGQTFNVTDSSASLTIPGSAIGEATSLLKATAITITASQFIVSDTGATPTSVDLGKAPFGPLASASTPVSGSNPATVVIPASPIAAVGPITAGSPGNFEAYPGASIADITFTVPSGSSDLGNTTCAAPSNPAPMVTVPIVSAPVPPTVSAISPTNGPLSGGTVVTITGTGLNGATEVDFGSTPGTSLMPMSDTSVMVTSPAATSAGPVDVTVKTPGGTSSTSSADKFTYNAPAPTVTSISPTSGSTAGGTSVTVTGTGLTGATEVDFGSTPGTSLMPMSDTSVMVTSPPGSAGPVDVTVKTPGGTSATSAGDQFTYVAPAPTVTAVSPSTGTTDGGTAVTITGTGLTGASAVDFGSIAATNVTVVSDTSVKATSPKVTSTGPVDVTVTTPNGTSATSAADQFTYTAPKLTPPPAVTGVTPSSGDVSGGQSVSIAGSGFTGATGVNFGSNPATSFNVVSDSKITAVAPAGTAGTVHVTVTVPYGTSANSSGDTFTYTTNAPTVTSVTPMGGPAGGATLVDVKGTNLSGTTSVSFGSNSTPFFYVVSDNELYVYATPGTTGTVDVTVTTPNGTSATSAADLYTYAAPAAPTVSGVYGVGGTSGSVVVILGTNFTGATSVSFGSNSTPFISVLSDSIIYAFVPPGTPGSTVDVTVTTPLGTSATSGADQYTYPGVVVPAAS